MTEEWRDIPGYVGKYQASSQGRIRSLTRSIIQSGRNGKPFSRVITGRVLRPASSHNNPHLYVVLGHGAHGSQVHQLVAWTFLGPQPPNSDVRHLNGNPQDNRPENLCYGSRTDNILDFYRQGRAWRKLDLSQIREIEDRIGKGETGHEIAQAFGVTDSTVSKIKLRRYGACSVT